MSEGLPFVSLMALLVYIVYLIVPGYLVLRLANCQDLKFICSFVISISILVLSQLINAFVGNNVESLIVCVHLVTAVVCVIGWQLGQRTRSSYITKQTSGWNLENLVWLGVIVIFTAYHYIVGSYTEIPSDFWAHLGEVVEAKHLMEQKGGFDTGYLNGPIVTGTFVHMLHAIVAHILDVHPLSIVREVTLVTSIIFLSTFFHLTIRSISHLGWKYEVVVSIAALASFLLVTTFGVASFSYIRYYAYFPHILNMALVFCLIIFLLDYLNKEEKWLSIFLVLISLAVIGAINLQELVFAVVLVLAISGVSFVRIWRSRSEHSRVLVTRSNRFTVSAFVISLIGCGVIISLFDRGEWNYPHLVNLGPVFGIKGDILIGNPQMRFWDTLAPFGIIVYIWYLSRLEWFQGCDYLNAGMLSPVITIFNPVFVYLFLHVSHWDPLWRFALLMPTTIVGAILVVRSIYEISENWDTKKNLYSAGFIGLGMLSILPWTYENYINRHSRFPSLYSVENNNGSELWGDVISFIVGIDGQRRLITDPVTGYVLSSVSMHRVGSKGKAGWQYNKDMFSGDYKDRFVYYGMDNSLIILNNRNGANSITGALSGHWPSDILSVASKYPKDLNKFLNDEPKEFERIWANNLVEIYQILKN